MQRKSTSPLNTPAVALPILCLLLSACALSPQTIRLNPVLEISDPAAVHGTTLDIQVNDRRSSQVIGYRGGVYSTDAISTENAAGSIQASLRQAFRDLGFSQPAGTSRPDSRLEVDIIDLEYKALKDKLLWKIEVNAVIEARGISGDRTRTNRIEDRRTKEFATAPSAEANAALINDVVT